MLYRRNVGSKESTTRMLGGLVVLAASLWQLGMTPLGLVLALSGLFTSMTGLFGYCPACAVVGRKSLGEAPR